MQHASSGAYTRQCATKHNSISDTQSQFKYTLFVNHELIGSYLTLVDLMSDVQAVSGQIKIQKTNITTNHHTFTTFKRGASYA